jgi:hypothetical protein
MEKFSIAFLEKSDISESSRVLSEAMLNVHLHIAVFQGHGEKERKIIEKRYWHKTFKSFLSRSGCMFITSILIDRYRKECAIL